MSTANDLFSTFKLGPHLLANRVVMAPMTRSRALEGNVPGPLAVEYYRQRASAGLIITEATQVSPEGQGYTRTPGIHSFEQVEAWKRVTDAVHREGGKIYLQLWHVGRIAHALNRPVPNVAIVAPSAIRAEGQMYTPEGMKELPVPRALELGEISRVVEDFRRASENALKAGFDGVEVHGANGYLADQFLESNSNKRSDRYGGSVENRARFLLEIVDAAASVWGADRVGVRLSPNGTFNDMHDENRLETFSYVIRELDSRGLAYLHLIEAPSLGGAGAIESPLRVFRPLFKGTIIAAQGFELATAQATIREGLAELVAFGRAYISNPDLVERLKDSLPLSPGDPATFYAGEEKGYIDYPPVRST
jgi:N-ethylmaleimide reductase